MIKVSVGIAPNREDVMVDPNTTLRKVFEDNGVDYASGSPTLDGSTLKAGDLDKTFTELGVTERCFLLVTRKLDNAAKVMVVGSTAVIRSDLPLTTIRMYEKYRPGYCRSVDYSTDASKVVFQIGVSSEGPGHISKYGISFSPTPAADGSACVTVQVPDTVSDPVAWLKEEYGAALLEFAQLEKDMQSSVHEMEEDANSVDAMFTVL